MTIAEYAAAMAGELRETLSQVSNESAERVAETILAAERVFVAGAGRSGFMARAFAMRLMHMGFEAYVVGETVTPNIEASDVLVVGSGSGETASLVSMAGKAKHLGAKLCLIGILPQSTIGQLADTVVVIPAPTPKAPARAAIKSIQPMGSLFEQCLLLVFDAIILRLMEKQGRDAEAMFNRHANLE